MGNIKVGLATSRGALFFRRFDLRKPGAEVMTLSVEDKHKVASGWVQGVNLDQSVRLLFACIL